MNDADREYYWAVENNFPDVSRRNWFNNAVSTTQNAGIVIGMPCGNFQPQRPITRAELAAATVRFLGLAPDYGSPLFNDISGHWAAGYINTAAQAGWTTGTQV